MKPEIKEKWLAALRSGEFKPAKGLMRTGFSSTSFCCLGVLCELYRRENEPEADFVSLFRDGALKTHVLPDTVRQWSGLNNIGLMEELASSNDKFGKYPVDMIERL